MVREAAIRPGGALLHGSSGVVAVVAGAALLARGRPRREDADLDLRLQIAITPGHNLAFGLPRHHGPLAVVKVLDGDGELVVVAELGVELKVGNYVAQRVGRGKHLNLPILVRVRVRVRIRSGLGFGFG